jgi:hypothetical protein
MHILLFVNYMDGRHGCHVPAAQGIEGARGNLRLPKRSLRPCAAEIQQRTDAKNGAKRNPE